MIASCQRLDYTKPNDRVYLLGNDRTTYTVTPVKTVARDHVLINDDTYATIALPPHALVEVLP